MSGNQLAASALALILSACLFSCDVTHQTVYFTDNSKTDSSVYISRIPPAKQSVISPSDVLGITVTSISNFQTINDPVAIFNNGGIQYPLAPTNANGGGGGGGGGGSTNGYLVDSAGYITYAVIGKMHVAGLSIMALKDTLTRVLARDYLKNPVVEIRIINYKVTVLGQVRNPGVVVAPNQRMTVVEAIGAAGDISLDGRKDNVMVIRENNGQREFARIDLSSRYAFSNPYFNLRQNDIVYVEAAKAQRNAEGNSFTRFYLPIITAIAGLTFTILTFLKISG